MIDIKEEEKERRVPIHLITLERRDRGNPSRDRRPISPPPMASSRTWYMCALATRVYSPQGCLIRIARPHIYSQT